MSGALARLSRALRRAPHCPPCYGRHCDACAYVAQKDIPAFRLTRQGLLPTNEAGWQALRELGQ